MNDIEKAKDILFKENLTCVILKGDKLYKSTKRGVSPIMELIDNDVNIEGAFVADKVIGKAAALLFMLCRVKEIYSPVMSEPAIEALKLSDIKFHYEESVPYIINRTNDGQCPMEKAVRKVDDPKEALIKIRDKIKELSNKSGPPAKPEA